MGCCRQRTEADGVAEPCPQVSTWRQGRPREEGAPRRGLRCRAVLHGASVVPRGLPHTPPCALHAM